MASHLCRVRCRQRRFPRNLLELRRLPAPCALTFDIAVWFQKICRLPSGGFSDLLDVRCNSQRERRRVFAASYRDSLAVAFERIVARIGHV